MRLRIAFSVSICVSILAIRLKKCVENFCSVSLTETYDLREFDSAFFKMLNEFFASH